MAVSSPGEVTFPAITASDQFGVGRVIGQGGEISLLCTTPHTLYASTALRVVYHHAWVPDPITTTSATDDDLPDVYARKTDRDDLIIETYGEDIIVTVEILTTGAVSIASTSLTHPSGGATAQQATLTTSSATEVLVRLSVRRNTTSGTLYRIRVLEQTLAAGDLPT